MVGLILAAVLALALLRITVDTDVAGTLPTGDRVVADAMYLFRHHPIKDRIAVDVGLPVSDRPRLIAAGRRVEAVLAASGLFAQVGLDRIQRHLPALLNHIDQDLPLLLTAGDLQRHVLPRLERARIAQRLDRVKIDLQGLDGIGRAREFSRDPLGLNQIVLARLAHLAPTSGGTFVQGHLVSADGRHLLIPATPKGSGTDTALARRLTGLIRDLEADLNAGKNGPETVTLTAVGAFRAALDNETIVRRDVNSAIAWATAGIAVLLLFAFTRPLIGLLAFLPALAGVVAALAVFAFWAGRISVLVLGFGGAVISISVDHGIAYLLFLEQSAGGDSRRAAYEIRAVGMLAVLTTLGAFGILGLSPFPIFAQLGRFTVLGIGAAFIFVHTVMPRLFIHRGAAVPTATPAAPLARLAARVPSPGLWGAVAAGVLMLALAGFAQVRLDTRLERMNSISASTRDAEALIARVWGNVFERVYLMIEAQRPEDLQRRGDALLGRLEAEAEAGRVAAAVTAASFFPGPGRQSANRSAWSAFWTAGRVARLRADLAAEAEARGFRPEAFAPFFRELNAPPPVDATPLPEDLSAFLGLSRDLQNGLWRQVAWIAPGPGYDAGDLFQRLGKTAHIFDPAFFAQRLGRQLSDTFKHLMAVVGACMGILLLIFFADLGLVCIALLPLVFAVVCTLGTLGLMGRPLDIAALMLGVVILGLGVDYALLLIGAFQRYQRLDHPRMARVRLAILLAGGSTLIGFTVLALADHTVLQSAGTTSALGIGYCLIGAFLIVPPLLQRRLRPPRPGPLSARDRYRNLASWPRLVARFRLGFDPIFAELEPLLGDLQPLSTIIEVGCGYGLRGAWLLERYPAAVIWATDPDPERARVAGLVLGRSGIVVQAGACQAPDPPRPADLALMIDADRHLNDAALKQALERLRSCLAEGGCLVVRSLAAPARRYPAKFLEHTRLRRKDLRLCRRSAKTLGRIIRESGFELETWAASGRRRNRVWALARANGRQTGDGAPQDGGGAFQPGPGALRQQSGSEAK